MDFIKNNMKVNLTVVKRNGRRVEFDGEKIGIVVQKAFASFIEDEKYKPEDSNKVFESVIHKLNKFSEDRKTIKVEEIQDIIAKTMKDLNYLDVEKSFSEYREHRAASRENFSRRQSKLMKAIENINKEACEVGDKRENANINGDTAMGQMLEYGSTIGREVAKAYIFDKKFGDAHDEGRIHIHDLDFVPEGTTTCTQIDLSKLFKGGFNTGHGTLREPQSIGSAASLAAIIVQANQNEQHGGQSIDLFEYYLAPYVLKSFKKNLKQILNDLLDVDGFLDYINFDKIVKSVDKIKTISVTVDYFKDFYKDNVILKHIFEKSIEKALTRTDRNTYQAMEGFIHNLNTLNSRAGSQVPFSSINFGTDISPEGRMVSKNFLLATEAGLGEGETPIFPVSIFRVMDGVNYNPSDPNYDLFVLACKVSAKRLFPNFEFEDAPYNKEFYTGDPHTLISTMGCRTRVMANVFKDRQVTSGRGNLSFTSINLPRIGIKHGRTTTGKLDLEGFYKELDETMDLVKDELLQRFEYQGNKKVKNFPFLLGQGVWIGSEKLGPDDKAKKVIKDGTLSIGFIGLAETLVALIGKHHGESDEAQKLGLEIIGHMRKRVDYYVEKYHLNFSLLGTPAEGLSGRFVAIDRSIYGKIPGVTDKDYYTNSSHVPPSYHCTIKHKIAVEAPYHSLENGGHIFYCEVDGNICNNIEAFMKIVRMMHDANVGYGAINHPVDRCPVCGYNGVLGDTCPKCGHKDGEDGIRFQRIARITGYLVGTIDRWNKAKLAELKDRVKHQL